jgi:hypothetical protein
MHEMDNWQDWIEGRMLIWLLSLGAFAASACGVGTVSAPTAQLRNQRCDVPLWRSEHAIRAILKDLVEADTALGGGGIGRIEETAPKTYAVYLPQNERTDVVTYVVEVDVSCNVRIVSRTESTVDAGGARN